MTRVARLLSAATADVEHVLEPAMRGYHIRISLARPNIPAQSSSSATSTSYKHTSAIPGAQAFVPSSLFQPLPAHAPRFASRRNTFSVQNLSTEKEKQPEDPERRDYRFGPLRIDWVEFSDMDAPRSSFMKVGSASGSGKDKEKSAQRRGGLSFTSCVPFSRRDTSNDRMFRRRTSYREVRTEPRAHQVWLDEPS